MNEDFRPRLYRFLSALARVLSFVFFPLKVKGLENVPSEGAVILCANHVTLADPVLMASVVKQPVRYMAKKELFQARWFGSFLRHIGAFPVNRGEADIGAVRHSIALLQEGLCLGIFAQGTRRRKNMAEPAMNTGVALIAIRSKAPVVPVRIEPYHIFGRVRMTFGQPMDFSAVKRADSAVLSGTTEEIRRAIFSLGETEPSSGE